MGISPVVELDADPHSLHGKNALEFLRIMGPTILHYARNDPAWKNRRTQYEPCRP